MPLDQADLIFLDSILGRIGDYLEARSSLLKTNEPRVWFDKKDKEDYDRTKRIQNAIFQFIKGDIDTLTA